MFSLKLIHITYLIEESKNALFVMLYRNRKLANTLSIQATSNLQSSGNETKTVSCSQ